MTPADRLTRAADLLDRMAYGQFYNPEDASLIAVTSDPVAVRLIAALLRGESRRAGGAVLGIDFAEALALADHINERSTP